MGLDSPESQHTDVQISLVGAGCPSLTLALRTGLCTTSIAPCSLQIEYVLRFISFLNCLLTIGPSPSPSRDRGEYNPFRRKGSHPHLQTPGAGAAARRPWPLFGLLGTAGGGIAQRLGAWSPGIACSACLGVLRAALASPGCLGSPRLNFQVQHRLWAEPRHTGSVPCAWQTPSTRKG